MGELMTRLKIEDVRDPELRRRLQTIISAAAGGHVKTQAVIPRPKRNKTEREFWQITESRVKAGELQWAGWECCKFLVGAGVCWYCPDVIALDAGGNLIAYEVKGFWRDDARVKIKAAAKQYPWIRFIAVRKTKSMWVEENIE